MVRPRTSRCFKQLALVLAASVGLTAAIIARKAVDADVAEDFVEYESSVPGGATLADTEALLRSFSEAAQEKALLTHQQLQFTSMEDCPTTYIYDIPELWDLDSPLSEPERLFKEMDRYFHNISCGDGLYGINQWAMPLFVLKRVLTSPRCKRASSPEEADLLLVPYFPLPKTTSRTCATGPVDPEPYLTHLDESNAHKHVFLLGKGHLALDTCGSWWSTPTGLLSRAIRVTSSMAVRGRYEGKRYGPYDSQLLTLGRLAAMTSDFYSDDVVFPHLFSAPYPAVGMLGTKPAYEPWKDSKSARTYLAYFTGGAHGQYGMEVRMKIMKDCAKVGSPTCLYVKPDIKNSCNTLPPKLHSYFCLEPGGDAPFRKSMYDDLSMGCVPVLFSPYLQLVAPWHWGHFRNDSHVYINREDYLEGRLDLFQVLQEVASSPRMRQLRETIAANAHSVQYSDTDYAGDGVERLLIGAHRAAKQLERPVA